MVVWWDRRRIHAAFVLGLIVALVGAIPYVALPTYPNAPWVRIPKVKTLDETYPSSIRWSSEQGFPEAVSKRVAMLQTYSDQPMVIARSLSTGAIRWSAPGYFIGSLAIQARDEVAIRQQRAVAVYDMDTGAQISSISSDVFYPFTDYLINVLCTRANLSVCTVTVLTVTNVVRWSRSYAVNTLAIPPYDLVRYSSLGSAWPGVRAPKFITVATMQSMDVMSTVTGNVIASFPRSAFERITVFGNVALRIRSTSAGSDCGYATDAVDISTKKVVWSRSDLSYNIDTGWYLNDGGGCQLNADVWASNVAFAAKRSDGNVVVVDASSGIELWSETPGNRLVRFSDSLVVSRPDPGAVGWTEVWSLLTGRPQKWCQASDAAVNWDLSIVVCDLRDVSYAIAIDRVDGAVGIGLMYYTKFDTAAFGPDGAVLETYTEYAYVSTPDLIREQPTL